MKNSLMTKQIFLIAVLMLVMGVLIVQAHYAFYTDSVTASNVMSADSIAWFNTQYDYIVALIENPEVIEDGDTASPYQRQLMELVKQYNERSSRIPRTVWLTSMKLPQVITPDACVWVVNYE